MSFPEDRSYASIYQNRIVSGIIVISNRLNDPKIGELDYLKIPTVLVPGELNGSRFPSVNVDNVNGAFEATEYIISLGHRRIAFLCGNKESTFCVERVSGFRKAFRKHHLRVNEELIIETDFSQASGYQAMEALLKPSLRPTAVMCINDATAVGALSAIKRRRLRVPKDISLTGFGDTILAEYCNPPLTTVKEPFGDIGSCAVEMLIDLITGEKRKNWNIVLPVKLMICSSTQKVSLHCRESCPGSCSRS